MLTDTRESPFAKVFPLNPGAVACREHGFWRDYFHTLEEKTLLHLKEVFESDTISHVVANFKIAAGITTGEHQGAPFGDGDFYKFIEALLYVSEITGAQDLRMLLEDYIGLIERAQQPDGYISTKQIIGERDKNGSKRLTDINDFEVYNMGHLFTTACLHKRLTGEDRFFQIAVKAAGYLERLYHKAAITKEVKTAVCPSHYMGLIELYRTTKEKRYLELAKLSIELRDSIKDGSDDNQDRLPLKQHDRVIGHAVRANYLYAGVADLYLENGDPEYRIMLQKVWRNLMDQKVYITGGCGALYNGTSPYGNFWIDQKVHQAYGYEYQLPNITAYNETCASLGAVFWAYRMFLADPAAEYFDYIERAMLNVNLAAISLDGKKFFYENMLRRVRKLPYELIWPLERTEYISSFCCPPNLARVLSQISEYFYTVSGDGLWCGLYGACTAKVSLKNGADFTIVQETDYPWEEVIAFSVKDTNHQPFDLFIRIPGWLMQGTVQISQNQESEVIELDHAKAGTYLKLPIKHPEGARIVVTLQMPVRYTVSHPYVEENNNQVAVERGPLVYCMETPDTPADTLDEILLKQSGEYHPVSYEIQGRDVIALEGTACVKELQQEDRKEQKGLYQTFHAGKLKDIPVRLIPYFAWDNRGFGEMRIWFPVAYRTI